MARTNSVGSDVRVKFNVTPRARHCHDDDLLKCAPSAYGTSAR